MLKRKNIAYVSNTIIFAILFLAFWFGSSGHSLRVTFIPGLLASYLIVLWLLTSDRRINENNSNLTYHGFTLLICVQLLHFAEEYSFGFNVKFPAMYGGAAYDEVFFLWFNMVSYSVFLLSGMSYLVFRYKLFLLPMVFFIVYGAIGNAISHTFWVVKGVEYFPGFYTGLVYFVLGPWVLSTFVGRKITLATIIVFGLCLMLFLNIYYVRPEFP